MAERIIFTCDRCAKDFVDHTVGTPVREFPAQWSCTQQRGVTVFILCESCTTALQVFLGRVPSEASAGQSSCDALLAPNAGVVITTIPPTSEPSP